MRAWRTHPTSCCVGSNLLSTCRGSAIYSDDRLGYSSRVVTRIVVHGLDRSQSIGNFVVFFFLCFVVLYRLVSLEQSVRVVYVRRRSIESAKLVETFGVVSRLAPQVLQNLGALCV
jgi:hypothetical protein